MNETEVAICFYRLKLYNFMSFYFNDICNCTQQTLYFRFAGRNSLTLNLKVKFKFNFILLSIQLKDTQTQIKILSSIF